MHIQNYYTQAKLKSVLFPKQTYGTRIPSVEHKTNNMYHVWLGGVLTMKQTQLNALGPIRFKNKCLNNMAGNDRFWTSRVTEQWGGENKLQKCRHKIVLINPQKF